MCPPEEKDNTHGKTDIRTLLTAMGIFIGNLMVHKLTGITALYSFEYVAISAQVVTGRRATAQLTEHQCRHTVALV